MPLPPIITMKFLAITFLVTLATASPIAAPEPEFQLSGDLEARQILSSKSELESGSASRCPKAILVFARGSTETGNLVCPPSFPPRSITFDGRSTLDKNSGRTEWLTICLGHLGLASGLSTRKPVRSSERLGTRCRRPIRCHNRWQLASPWIHACCHRGNGSPFEARQLKVPQ